MRPDQWHISLKKVKTYLFCDWCQHFNSLKHLRNTLNSFIDSLQNLNNCKHFHVYKCIYWVRRAELSLRNLNLWIFFWSKQSAPKLANRSKRLWPLFFVESHLTCTYSSQWFKLVDNLQTIESLDTSINVWWQAKQLRSINFGNLIDNHIEISDLLGLRYS